MPELPEVETTRQGISPALVQQIVERIIIRQPQLRWPIPSQLPQILKQQQIQSIDRRGKYLLMQFNHGTLLIHLGMSGRLHVLEAGTKAQKHDHVDILCTNGYCLRYTDPRRFGCMLWTEQDPHQHPLLAKLGPEPLSKHFTATYLYQRAKSRKVPIKSLIMNAEIVVGVGNIYAQEALFVARISPLTPCHQLSQPQLSSLVKAICNILKAAIKAGGSTLKDFYQSDGKPGYFQQQHLVYGKYNQPCPSCQEPLQHVVINQRSTIFCEHCQC